MSNININPNDNPTRRQSSLGGNVRFRDAGNVEGNYGIFLAYVTHVYYQEGTLDFDARDTIENLVDVGLGKGLGQAPIPVETFGTNSDGKVYGQYRPINVGDKVAIAYLNGSRRTPIVIGVYPKNSSSYELVSPVPFNMKNESDDEAEVTTLSDKKIYPSQQVFYQSGKGDIFRSLGGHSFMTLNEDQMDFTKDLDYAYNAISAFYDNNGEQLNPQEDKAQAWLLVHEDNPDSNSADGHRTRFYVAKDGEVQLVFTNSNNPGILILQGSLDKGLTIKKQYDTSVIDDDSSNEYVTLNIGGESGFSLDVHNVSGNNLTRSAKNSTNFAVKSDDVYVNNVSLTDLIGENADDIQQIIDNNQKYNQEYFDKLDKSTKEAGQIARNAARDAHEAGAHAHDAGEQAKATSKDIKDRIMYYMNISPEEDVYVPNKYLIIHTDTFIEDATIKQGMIDDLAVGTAQIAYEAVGTAEIEDLAVSSAKIDNLAVTDEKVGHLTFDHMIGEQIDANTIDVVNLHGDNITAGTITADKILINGLGDLSHHLGDITDGHIQSGDNGVIIDDLPADDPDQWTPAKKALLKQQIGILEAEANATIQYGDNVGITSDTIENAKNALINGTASLLTNMTTTEKFSNSQIQTWISDLKNAVEDFRNEANDTLIKKVGTTESGNNIYQGPEEPDPANVHLGDIWFKEYEKDGKTTYEQLVYGNDGWYSPSDYNITQIQEQLDKLPTPYYQADEPQGDIKKDDTWYKTSTDSNGNINYTAYKYDGYDWQPMLPDNVNKNTSGTSAPANPRPGDQWYDETTKELKQLNDQGTDWIVIPTQGPQGIPGTDGSDGKSSYTHIAYATSSTGSGFTQTPTSSTTYMGVYVNQIATDSTNPADYRWSLIKGADGAQGTPGKAGADGKTPYFHIAYANNATGTEGFSTTDSQDKTYIGQYTDYTEADSNEASSYAWTKIKGDKGDQGKDGYTPIKGTDYFDGKDGQDGKSSYLWIKYSANPDGTGMTSDPTGAKYVGYATTQTATAPTSSSAYKWQLVAGKDGIAGEKGADGKTSYLHIRYSNDGGKTFTANSGENVGTYIGQYTDFTQSDSDSVSAYKWALIKGDKGDKGSDGLPGKDGVGIATTVVTYQASTSGTTVPSGTWSISVPSVSKGQYLWTRTVWTYTDKSSEVGYSVAYIAKDGNDGTNGVAGKDGVGIKSTTITYAQSTSGTVAPTTGYTVTVPSVPEGQFLWTKTVWTYTDGTNETGYSVGKIGEKGDTGAQGLQGLQGPQGDQGIQGPKGLDGKTYYTWIKYATSDSGANMSDNPEGMDYIGLAYNKDSADESSVATDYTWSLFKGPQGDQGVPGADGKDGKPSYTWIKYADSPTSGMSDSPDGKQYMGIVTNKDTATESSDYSDYTWSLINDNSKKRNFVDTPTTPYDIGDTWTQSGATYYCATPRKSGAFDQSDWTMQQLTITSLSDDVKDGIDQINNLQIGGRNLIISSDLVNGWLDDLGNIAGVGSTPFTTGIIDTGSNQDMTITKDGKVVIIGEYDTDNKFIKKNRIENPDMYYKFKTGEETKYIRVTFGFDKKDYGAPYKVEKGNKATDWSPAPEDMINKQTSYKGVTINENGLTATAGSTQVALNSSDGFLIKKGSSTLFNADTSGNLNMQGNITAGNISGVNFTGNNLTLAGSLKTTGSLSSGNGKVTLSNTGLNIKGAGLTIGDSSGTTTTMISEDGTFTANKAVLSGSLTSNSVNITGGTINMNGGAFSVDKSGNVVANSFTGVGSDTSNFGFSPIKINIGSPYSEYYSPLTHSPLELDMYHFHLGSSRTDFNGTTLFTYSEEVMNNSTGSITYHRNNDDNNVQDFTVNLGTIDATALNSDSNFEGQRISFSVSINYDNATNFNDSYVSLTLSGSAGDKPFGEYNNKDIAVGNHLLNWDAPWSKNYGSGNLTLSLVFHNVAPHARFYVYSLQVYASSILEVGNPHPTFYDDYIDIKSDGSLTNKHIQGNFNPQSNSNYLINDTLDMHLARLSFSHGEEGDIGSYSGYPYSETQVDGTGIIISGNVGSTSLPRLSFTGSPIHETLLHENLYGNYASLVNTTGGSHNGMYFDAYGNIHGFSKSVYWSVVSNSGDKVIEAPLSTTSGDLIFQSKYSNTGFRTKNYFYVDNIDGTRNFIINSSGATFNSDIKANSFTKSSKASIKRDISVSDTELLANKIYNFTVADWNYIDDPIASVNNIGGVITSDNTYSVDPLFLNETGEGIDQTKLIAGLIATVQEQSKQLSDLYARLTLMEVKYNEG